jgi:hypothetical protein
MRWQSASVQLPPPLLLAPLLVRMCWAAWHPGQTVLPVPLLLPFPLLLLVQQRSWAVPHHPQPQQQLPPWLPLPQWQRRLPHSSVRLPGACWGLPAGRLGGC